MEARGDFWEERGLQQGERSGLPPRVNPCPGNWQRKELLDINFYPSPFPNQPLPFLVCLNIGCKEVVLNIEYIHRWFPNMDDGEATDVLMCTAFDSL